MAHKKAGGSTSNSKDSAGRRLGTKLADGQMALNGGEIIHKQLGTRIFPGKNVLMGKTYSLHAKVPGIVRFIKKNNKTYATIEPK